MHWGVIMQYRLDTILWILAEAIEPLVAMAIWLAVAKEGGSAYTVRETFTYYILAILVFMAVFVWTGFLLSQDILDGKIVQYLVKPYSVFWFLLSSDAAENMFKFILPIPVFIASVVLFPQIYAPAIYEPMHIALFCLSIVLAIGISFTFEMSLSSLAFWMEEVNELRGFKNLFQEMASGLVIPFIFLPPLAVTLFSFLPFRFMISVPIEIIMGQLEGLRAWQFIGYQVIWLAILSIIMRFVWTRGLRHYAPPGQ
jgi:ABC-2 type transport system permease protein